MSALRSRSSVIAIGAALLCQAPAHAQLPSGGSVAAGAAAISQTGQSQVIDQSTPKAIINWQDFSIGAGNSVRFNQPGSNSVILNRVTGGNPTSILGSMSANGQVFLVNPFGVYFGAGASVDVGSLLATTLTIRDDDFMAGNYVFSRAGLAARREVVNAGVLKAREGGYVVLAGDYAANSGVIQARLGTVALASGSRLTLDIAGDSLVNYSVDEKTVAALSGVDNSGQLLADGGRAIMTAAVARDLAAASVNNSGLVRAQSTVERDGEIYLSADGGSVQVSGTLDASGRQAGQAGGRIGVLGEQVTLTGNARLDATGDTGGGRINVGGSYQGKGPLLNAQTTEVGKGARILADATGTGKGGDVVIWADGRTRYEGDISARGGAQGGDGGNVEVSGKALLHFEGTVDTRAPAGKTGHLLLDPTDIEVVNPGMIVTPAPAGVSQMTVGALETALNANNVTLQTSAGSGAPQGGTITIDDGSGGGVQWGAATTLKLQADNRIVIKSHVQGANGSIWLDAVNGGAQDPNTNIAANSLLVTGGGSWDLAGVGNTGFVNSYNDVNTLAVDITGNSFFRFGGNRNLTVGTVNGVSGINRTGGDVQIYLDRNNASLQLAQNVTTGSIFMRAQGGVNQTGGTLTANSVGINGGAVSLTQSGNRIGTFAAGINGSLNLVNSQRLTIGNPYGIAGISTGNGNVTITTGDAAGYDPERLPTAASATSPNPPSLRLNESINAGTGAVRLNAGAGGVFQRADIDTATSTPLEAGSIKARNLLLMGSSGSKVTPFVLNNSHNLVNTMAARANGSIAYTGGPLTVGSVGSVAGIVTTANTVVKPAGIDPATNQPTPDIYNDNNVTLSIGGNLNINSAINAASANGSGVVSIGMGGDFTTATAAGVRIDANTLSVVGDEGAGTFRLTTHAKTLTAAGGKSMAIDNSQYAGELLVLGIGAQAAAATVPAGAGTGSGSVSLPSVDKPVGDFYLVTGGDMRIIKISSVGDNLLLRANALSILLDAATKDGARIMLQPTSTSARIGIHNENDADFTADVNYSADLLRKFTNPTATFFFGTPQNVILNDAGVSALAKNIHTGDIHIGSDGEFGLGYRSLSAQTTGSMVVHNAGPLYNLRLAATNLTIHSFKTFGPQMHFFSNNLSLPSPVTSYQNPNKPNITLRTLNDETVWIGIAPNSKARPEEKQILSQTIAKLPDGSTIIISGSTDYPFPSGGSGYGDIHIPWNDSLGVKLGNRKLVLSTGKDVHAYGATPAYTKKNDGGTSGGLWQGCQNLTDCMGENPNPFPETDPGGTGAGDGGAGDGGTPSNPGGGGCTGCPPAPPGTDPYPPDTGIPGGDSSSGGTGDPGAGDGGGGSGTGDGGGGDGGGGSGTGGGGTGDGGGGSGTGDGGGGDGGGSGTGGGGTGDGGGGSGTGDGGTGDGGGGSGTGGGGTGDGGGGSGTGGGGTGDGGGGSGTGGGGTGDGGGGSGTGDGGTGDGGGGTGDGGGGSGTGDGSGGSGTGDGSGGSGTGGGGTGDGGGGSGTGDGGNGDGTGGSDTGGGGAGDGAGDGGAGTGGGGTGDGSGGSGTGDGSGEPGSGDTGDGGAGNGSGGPGDGGGDGGSGTGGGGTGDGSGGSGTGDGSGEPGSGDTGDGGAGNGSGGPGDGSGDGGAGTGGGGTGDGSDGSGTGDGSDAPGSGDKGDGGGDRDVGMDDAGAPPAVDISCADVSATGVRDAPTRDGGKDGRSLVEVSQEGVKMRDPCQKQPEPAGQAGAEQE